ncbi:hypothetical protein IAQ67_16160 [Paenibacillus peoriae]|uniref:DUF2325 domain-containing protein n=1 Tax=Paenibacillus peoriae TaxID=59893 RepID=A0A7H0Y2W9_9BACL|nr:hypothetical protein [Paenibacillus peoriae]QNR65427.1 hypothetical protein IAQ67_16160 [Paenibacillus peoriae]
MTENEFEKNVNKNKEIQKRKKDLLLKKVKEVQLAAKQETNQSVDYKKEYEQLLINYTKLKKEHRSLKNKKDKSRAISGKENEINEIVKLKNTIKSLKLTIYKQSKLLEDFKNKSLLFENEKIENQKLSNELKRLSSSQLLHEKESLVVQLETEQAKTDRLKEIIDGNETYRKTQEKKYNRQMGEFGRLKFKSRQMEEELKKKSQIVDNLYNSISLAKLFSLLDERLVYKSVFSFYPLNKLYTKYLRIRHLAEIQEKEEREKRIQQISHQNKIADSSYKDYGFIVKEEDQWYFYDLNNNVYLVTSSKTKLIPDLPASAAIYEDGTAYVFYVYYDSYEENDNNTDNKNHEKKDDAIEKKEGLKFGEDLNILVVGSRNISEYSHRLESHGFNVETHNPFEESYHLIEGKVRRSDIVIVCTSHIDHSIMDFIDKDDQKVELIEKDSSKKILVRARYAAIKLGLIE